MKEELSPELKKFVVEFCKKYKIKNNDVSRLTINSSLDLDLNMFDLTIDQFVIDFSEKFNVDISKFTWFNYGYPKGSFLILLVRSFLNYKLLWVRRLAHKIYRPKIRMSVFQDAIKTGVLQ